MAVFQQLKRGISWRLSIRGLMGERDNKNFKKNDITLVSECVGNYGLYNNFRKGVQSNLSLLR